MASSLVAGVWGGLAWARNRPSVTFWYLLRAAQGAVVGQAVLGVLLLLEGDEPSEKLHYVYGLAPLVVSLVTESMRAGAAQRELDGGALDSADREERRHATLRIVRYETGVMAAGALLIFGLAVRAGMTSGHLF